MVDGVGQQLPSADSQSMCEGLSEPHEMRNSRLIPPPTPGMFLITPSSL